MDKPDPIERAADPIATVREAQAELRVRAHSLRAADAFLSAQSVSDIATDLDAVVATLERQAQEIAALRAGLTPAAEAVLAERRRQIEAEGWTPEHDDEHKNGEMAFAAACYAAQAASRAWLLDDYPDGAERYASDSGNLPDDWPDSWAESWWKPKNPRRDLERAAALILAEIERLDRADAARAKEAGDA